MDLSRMACSITFETRTSGLPNSIDMASADTVAIIVMAERIFALLLKLKYWL